MLLNNLFFKNIRWAAKFCVRERHCSRIPLWKRFFKNLCIMHLLAYSLSLSINFKGSPNKTGFTFHKNSNLSVNPPWKFHQFWKICSLCHNFVMWVVWKVWFVSLLSKVLLLAFLVNFYDSREASNSLHIYRIWFSFPGNHTFVQSCLDERTGRM